MEKKERFVMAMVLLLPLLGLSGWYGWVVRSANHHVPIEEKMLTPHDGLFAVQLKDSRAWIVGKHGLILHSEDGGKSWNKQRSGTTKALTAVSFADQRHGFAVGNGGTILATRDAGRTWEAKTSGTTDHLLDVQALSPQVVYAVGAFGTILHTTDGGATWEKQAFSWEQLIPQIIKDGGYMEPNLNAIHFATPQIGWVAGEFGLVLHTRDGGQTWISQRYETDLPQITSIRFRDALNGWAIGQQGTFLRTENGGKHWTESPIEMKNDLYEISLDGESGVVVGDSVVLKTDNRGSDWVSLKDSTVENLWLSGVAVNSGDAIGVGQGGTIRIINLADEERPSHDEELPGQ